MPHEALIANASVHVELDDGIGYITLTINGIMYDVSEMVWENEAVKSAIKSLEEAGESE